MRDLTDRMRLTAHEEVRDLTRIHLSSPDVGDARGGVRRRGDQVGLGRSARARTSIAFERELAERVGVAHGVALSSGTAALHLALVSWGVGAGRRHPDLDA